MTEGQKLIWKLRLREAAEFAVCFAVVWSCLWIAHSVLDWKVRLLVLLPFAGIGAFLVWFGWQMVIYRRSRKEQERSEAGKMVSLKEFLSISDATLAPNFPEHSTEIAQWLEAFAASHGRGSVKVAVNEDEPHLSDRIFLLVDELSEEERQALLSFKTDGVKTVPLGTARALFPKLRPGVRVYCVVWD